MISHYSLQRVCVCVCVCAQMCASSGKGWLDEEKVRNVVAPHFPYCSSVAAPKFPQKENPREEILSVEHYLKLHITCVS